MGSISIRVLHFINEVDYFFIYLLTICEVSFVKCIFCLFFYRAVHLLFIDLFFRCSRCKSPLCICGYTYLFMCISGILSTLSFASSLP
jgi:hypothetical protein